MCSTRNSIRCRRRSNRCRKKNESLEKTDEPPQEGERSDPPRRGVAENEDPARRPAAGSGPYRSRRSAQCRRSPHGGPDDHAARFADEAEGAIAVHALGRCERLGVPDARSRYRRRASRLVPGHEGDEAAGLRPPLQLDVAFLGGTAADRFEREPDLGGGPHDACAAGEDRRSPARTGGVGARPLRRDRFRSTLRPAPQRRRLEEEGGRARLGRPERAFVPRISARTRWSTRAIRVRGHTIPTATVRRPWRIRPSLPTASSSSPKTTTRAAAWLASCSTATNSPSRATPGISTTYRRSRER